MKNEKQGHRGYPPTYLNESPSVICEQVLWLIKNSGLNFQVKETPFSLDISLKKKFAHHWDQSSSSQQPLFSQHFHAQPQKQQPVDHAEVRHEELLTQLDCLKSNLADANSAKMDLFMDLLEIDKAQKTFKREQRPFKET